MRSSLLLAALLLAGCAGDIAFSGVPGRATPQKPLAVQRKTRTEIPWTPAPAPIPTPLPTKENTWIPRIGGYGDLPCVGGACPVER